MSRLSMVSLRKLVMARSVLLVFGLGGLLPLPLFAQTSGQDQPTLPASFDQLKSAVGAEVQNGEDAKAIEDIQRALAIEPDWKEGWWTLGTLQYEANLYSEAGQAFQKVIARAPQLGPAWAVSGLYEFELKQYAQSLSHLEKAQALGLGNDPETARVASYPLALLLIRDGQFERGAELLHSASGEGPPSSQVQFAWTRSASCPASAC